MSRQKKPVISIVVALALWILVGLGIVYVTPGKWWIEVPMIVALTGAVFLTASWIVGRAKWGVILTVILVGVLILNRNHSLNYLSLGILFSVLGLISLFN